MCSTVRALAQPEFSQLTPWLGSCKAQKRLCIDSLRNRPALRGRWAGWPELAPNSAAHAACKLLQRVARCVLCADLLGCACACCDSQENLPKRAKPGWCPSGQKPPRPLSSRGGFRQGEVQLGANRFSVATGSALRANQPHASSNKPLRANQPHRIKCRTPARHPTRGQSASGSTSVQTPQ